MSEQVRKSMLSKSEMTSSCHECVCVGRVVCSHTGIVLNLSIVPLSVILAWVSKTSMFSFLGYKIVADILYIRGYNGD